MLETLCSNCGNSAQRIWLDFLSRDLIQSGRLKPLIESDGVSGVASNPAIFEKAICGSNDYEAEVCRSADGTRHRWRFIRNFSSATYGTPPSSCCSFIPERMNDGYASLEVSSELAHDAERTIQETRRLWFPVSRSNVMIKIPATREGLAAIAQCMADGISM